MTAPSRPPRYIYQRRGGPLLSWASGPPSATRGADNRALGSLGDDDAGIGTHHVLPRGGAPEYLSSMGCAPDSDVDNQGEYIVLARGPLHRKQSKVEIALDVANLALTAGAIYLAFKFLKRP